MSGKSVGGKRGGERIKRGRRRGERERRGERRRDRSLDFWLFLALQSSLFFSDYVAHVCVCVCVCVWPS